MMVRGDEAPEWPRDCVAVFGGATIGAVSMGGCRAARASSASEQERRLPSSDAGRRTEGTGAPSGLASTGASCRLCKGSGNVGVAFLVQNRTGAGQSLAAADC
jgi:hypothetical protein